MPKQHIGSLPVARLGTSRHRLIPQVARIHASIRTQIFEPTGRSNKKQESKEAKAVCSAVSKAFAKMNHPRGSGLLRTGDLKRLVRFP